MRSTLSATKVAAGGGLAAALLLAAPAAAEPPRVVASIMPLHSLAAAVMAGVGEPELLVEGGASPHSFSLKPSDAVALDEAELVIWVGEGLELFLQRSLENLSEDAKVLTLSELQDVQLLPSRPAGLHALHEHDEQPAGDHDHSHGDHSHGGHSHGHSHGEEDPHLWLDPANGAAFGEAIAEALAELDPQSSARYRENAARLTAELEALEARLRQKLLPYQDRRFLVFHDAYQYFEDAFGLHSAGSITLDAERQPGARRLQDIRAWIDESDALCLFAEPQFEPRLLSMLTEGTAAQIGLLDPLGADLEPGPEAYFALLEGMGDNLVDCFEQESR